MDFKQHISIAELELFPIAASGGVSPQMAIGSMPSRPALLIRIRDSDGCYGWGEVWANFPPRAHLHKANLIQDVITPLLDGVSYTEPREVQRFLRDRLSIYFLHVGQQQVFEHILAGVDIALWDLSLRRHNYSVADYFGLTQKHVPCYASSINADDLEETIPLAVTRGQRHFKIKIGFQSDGGCSVVERATALCPRDCHVMIDSNQSWSFKEAISALEALQQYSPVFAEEPIAANAPLDQWEQLANATTIPLAGGENIYGVENFVSMANAGMSVLQPDVAKWGGVTGALDLVNALPQGIKLWPHFMGTALGQMASMAVTAIVGGDSVCEMDVNKNQLRTELCGDVMEVAKGCVKLHSGSGLITEPLPDKLQHFRLPSD